MTLRILLGLLALFTLLSGWMKSRARIRSAVGGAGLGAVELLAGFMLLIAQGPGMAPDGARMALGAFTAVVLVLSNVGAVLKASRLRRVREGSEGSRLYSSIKYQELAEEDGSDAPSSG